MDIFTLIIQIFNNLYSLGFTLGNIVPVLLGISVLYHFITKDLNSVKDGVSQDFKDLEKGDLAGIKERTTLIELAIIEMQTILRIKLKTDLSRTIATAYGKANSPLSLRDGLEEFITVPHLDQQISQKEEQLLKLIMEKNPKSGIDAQDIILDLVLTNKINDYLDLTSYKQNLYRKGKTLEDAYGILAVYLYQTLIPKLGY